jgi:hypothetical protein
MLRKANKFTTSTRSTNAQGILSTWDLWYNSSNTPCVRCLSDFMSKRSMYLPTIHNTLYGVTVRRLSACVKTICLCVGHFSDVFQFLLFCPRLLPSIRHFSCLNLLIRALRSSLE